MTLYATLPRLSLFLSFYCSRNFEACELNLFLSAQLSKSSREVPKFASVALVDIDFDEIQVHVKFDITFIPSTLNSFLLQCSSHEDGFWVCMNTVFLLFVYHVILAVELYVSKALSITAKFEL